MFDTPEAALADAQALVLSTEDFRLARPDEKFIEHGALFGTRPAFGWLGH